MYRQILVPVDGSSTSRAGLKQALGLAGDQHARVRVLNVIDNLALATAMDPYGAADMSMLLESLEKTGKKALVSATHDAAKAKVRADTVQLEGRGRFVSDVILAEANKCGADVIVMGTHGRKGMNRLLLGSDAERVLRDAPVPVLLVRERRKKPVTISADAVRRKR